MIHLMLDDLRRPAGEGFHAGLHFEGLILHLDRLVPFAPSGPAQKREATLLGVVCSVFFIFSPYIKIPLQ